MKRFLKRVLFATVTSLCVFGLASCDKNDEPTHDVELEFYVAHYDQIEPENIQKYVNDKSVRIIYLSLINGGVFTNLNTNNISNMRNSLSERINIAPTKIRGKGNFVFKPDVASKPDSLWFVKQGWTVNQKQK